MSVLICSHSHAHRLLQGGTIESAPLITVGVGAGKTVAFEEKDFQNLAPSEMNMTGAMVSEIRNQLEHLNSLMPADFVLPVRETVEKEKVTASTPV